MLRAMKAKIGRCALMAAFFFIPCILGGCASMQQGPEVDVVVDADQFYNEFYNSAYTLNMKSTTEGLKTVGSGEPEVAVGLMFRVPLLGP
jgi:hypothetical protein